MRKSLKQALIQVLKCAVAVALIAWLVYEGAIDFASIKRLITPISVLIGAALAFAMIFINNYRWLLLLRAQGFPTTIRSTLPLTFIGLFFNFAMPGGVGGDVVKGFYLCQDHPDQRMAAVISIFMDRVVGFCMMVTTAAVALMFSWNLVKHSNEMVALAIGIVVLFCCFMVFYGIALSRRVGRSRPLQFLFAKFPGGRVLKRIYEALHSYRKTPGQLFLAFILSVLSQFSQIILVMLVAQVMGIHEIPWLAYCFLVPLGIVATAIPIAPAGIGVGQAAFFFLFNLYLGKESQVGPTAVTVTQILSFLWGLLGAYFYLTRRRHKLPSKASATGGS